MNSFAVEVNISGARASLIGPPVRWRRHGGGRFEKQIVEDWAERVWVTVRICSGRVWVAYLWSGTDGYPYDSSLYATIARPSLEEVASIVTLQLTENCQWRPWLQRVPSP